MSFTRSIFIAFALSIVVEANFLAAVGKGIDPIILSAGSVLAALSLDGLETQPTDEVYFDWKSTWQEKFKETRDKFMTPEEVKLFEEYWEKAKKLTKGVVDRGWNS